MRLIDADALDTHLKRLSVSDMTLYCNRGFETARYEVSCAPIIDAAPVVHARWTENGICTNCGNEASYTEWAEDITGYDWDFNVRRFGVEVHREHKRTDFCPCCGARMDGDAEDDP